MKNPINPPQKSGLVFVKTRVFCNPDFVSTLQTLNSLLPISQWSCDQMSKCHWSIQWNLSKQGICLSITGKKRRGGKTSVCRNWLRKQHLQSLYLSFLQQCTPSPLFYRYEILGIRDILHGSRRFLIIHHQEYLFHLCIFYDNSIYGDSFSQVDHPYLMDQEGLWSSSIRKVLKLIF